MTWRPAWQHVAVGLAQCATVAVVPWGIARGTCGRQPCARPSAKALGGQAPATAPALGLPHKPSGQENRTMWRPAWQHMVVGLAQYATVVPSAIARGTCGRQPCAAQSVKTLGGQAPVMAPLATTRHAASASWAPTGEVGDAAGVSWSHRALSDAQLRIVS